MQIAGDLAVWFQRLDGFNVEVDQPIRRKILSHKVSHEVQTVLNVGDRVPGDLNDLLVVPDVSVEHDHFGVLLTWFEEGFVVLVSLVDVHGDDSTACRNLTRSVLQMLCIVQHILANLEAQVLDHLVKIVV